MKIALCDDCHEDIRHLKSLLGGHDITTYESAEELLTGMERENMHFDLYLLDIYLEEGQDAGHDAMNGIELAKRLREQDAEAVICFISTSNSFYREAYDLYALQYLIKPVQEADVKQLLMRVSQKSSREKEQTVSFKWRGHAGSVSYGNILYISSMGHNLSIYCKDGTVQECVGKLNELEKQLRGNTFCRCHQSFLVNLYQVDRMEGNEFMTAGYRIPVSRRYFSEAKKRYQEILFEEVD